MKFATHFLAAALGLALAAPLPALAQQSPAPAKMQFIVADASSSGTYKEMLGQVKGVCNSDDYDIVEADVKGGATDNLAALLANKVSAAFLHSDVIYFYGRTEPKYHDYKTLVALYPEDIHIVALRSSGIKAGGYAGTGIGAKVVEFTTMTDLAGYKVGAAGGGVITARILSGEGEGHFDVVQYNSGADVLAALGKNEIQAAVFVGGAPLTNVAALSADAYKLLSINEAAATRLSGVYRRTTINYVNLHSDNVPTLAPMATIVTRKYTVAKFVAPQRRFRECFYAGLTELQETPGNHPKWQLVNPDDHGVWEWYEFLGSPALAK